MYSIGIDLGGTNIAVGIVTKDGTVVKKTSVPTRAERPFDQIFADMANCIHKLLEETGIPLSQVTSIGIGTPGCIDSEKGILLFAGNFKYGTNVNFREEMAKHFSLPLYVGNDANVAALGEVVAGAAKGVKHAIMITLGTGVGGGIIINSDIYEGHASAAGELGHIVLVHDGQPCTCGRKGCWEAYASVTALIRQTKTAMEENPSSLMNQVSPEQVTGRTAFDAAKKGDAVALKVVDQYAEYISEGLADMVNIFSPQVLIVGGGISKEGDFLLDPVREKLNTKVFGNGLLSKPPVVAAQLGNDAGLIGAALLHA